MFEPSFLLLVPPVYLVLSYFFWKYPQYLHGKKYVPFNPIIVAHRGGAGEQYENTLEAFDNSIRKISQPLMLELDVRTTKDNQIIVIHDPSVLRLTGKDVKVSDLNYNEIPEVLDHIQLDTLKGSSVSFSRPSGKGNRVRIPLFSELLNLISECGREDVYLHVDVCGEMPMCCEVVRLLEKFGLRGKTVVGSTEYRMCSNCWDDSRYTYFSAMKIHLIFFPILLGLLPFTPLKETHYSLFLPQSLKNTNWGMGKVSIAFFSFIGRILVSSYVVKHLQRRGIKVILWVCNTPEEFQICLEKEVDGIMTDFPSSLQKYLKTTK